MEHSFTTWNPITDKKTTFKTKAEFPEIEFSKKFTEDVEKIGLGLNRNSVYLVEKKEKKK